MLLLYTLPTNFLVLVPLAVTAVAWQCLTASRQGISPESVQGECGNHRSGRDALEELHRRENGTVPFVRTTARAMRCAGIEAAAWSGACLLAAALYFPVRAQLLHAGREAVAFGFLGAGSLAGTVLRDAVHDWLPILPAAIAGLALWVRRVSRQRSSDTWAMPLVALGGVLGPFVLAGLTGIWGFERVFCPILPFLMAVLGCLLAECLRGGSMVAACLARGRGRACRGGDPCRHGGACSLHVSITADRIPPDPFAQDGYYNYYAANYHPAKVAAWLKSSIGPSENYAIYSADADHYALTFYLLQAGVPAKRIHGRGPRNDLLDCSRSGRLCGDRRPIRRPRANSPRSPPGSRFRLLPALPVEGRIKGHTVAVGDALTL